MSTTTNLALNEPAYNSTSPTWDQPLNYNATILDQMFGNTTGVSVNTGSSSTYTLITAPSSTAAGSTSQAMRFNLTGALAANQTVLLPQSVAGMWIISNNTTNAFSVSIGSNNGSNVAAGTTIAAPQGYSLLIFSDGTNVRYSDDGLINSTLQSLNVSGNATIGGKLTLSTNTTLLSALLNNISETATVSATAATGTINYYVTSQSVLYYTTNATGNFTINIAASSGTTLNTALGIGQAVTVVFLNTNGATPYYNSAVTIDGVSVTPKWQGGSAPTSGNASSVDIYSYTILKTASATYTVFASQSQFA